MSVRGRSKLKRLRTSLELESTAKQQQYEQLNADFKNAQQQLQQFEAQTSEKDSYIEQLEENQLATKDEVKCKSEHISKLENYLKQRNQQLNDLLENLGQNLELEEQKVPDPTDIWAESLWQRHNEVISELTERLNSEIQVQADLQESSKAVTQELQETLNAQVEQISQLKQELAAQESIKEQLQDIEQDLLSGNDENQKEDMARMSRLEQELSEKTSEIGQYNAQLEQKLEALKQDFNLALDAHQGKPLWQQYDELIAQLSQHQHFDKETIASQHDSVLASELADKSALISQLQQTIEGQENHISRLKDKLDEKKLMFQDQGDSDIHGIQTTLKQQEAGQALIYEPEQTLANQGHTSLKTTVEKIQHLTQDVKQQLDQQLLNPVKEQIHQLTENVQKIPHQVLDNLNREWLNPAKEQIDATTDKVKHLPYNLKDFFNHKLASIKQH